MTPTEIAEARRVIAAAAPGPWVYEPYDPDIDEWSICMADMHVPHTEPIITCGQEAYDPEPANGTFIAAARTGWPAALDHIDRLEAAFAARIATEIKRRHELDREVARLRAELDETEIAHDELRVALMRIRDLPTNSDRTHHADCSHAYGIARRALEGGPDA